ncbi:pilus assembly protein [Rhodoblastus acidophilus]|uniref:Pilus assembly protein n=1 Tax=Candidatus Rhodoblastus alkanivorans TaxID=2954117 RepID=A0ABS9Z2R2_9HYPH|nr:TadE/TadG family type IV pilus assembly protein [Candidatus Rhodoblastus alkanivorans]MCI4679721.1 pilus assembly protein [Candidatus Rhodoblastus alkanivorans]MCI4681959.1 pilus assembly protein [Candidatus Rhodoblastus alkanivorans]
MASRFLRDRRAVTAVEFALVVPIALLLLIGEYNLTDAMSTKRKLTITAHTIADLVARQPSVNASLMTAILNASAQIVSPYNMSNTSVVVAELTTDGSGKTTVTWSQAINGTALSQGAKVTLPAGLAEANTSIIYASVSFTFTPVFNGIIVSPTVFNSTFYENPRISSTVPYTN